MWDAWIIEMLRQACLQISTKICMAGQWAHKRHIWLSSPSHMIARFVGCHCHHFIHIWIKWWQWHPPGDTQQIYTVSIPTNFIYGMYTRMWVLNKPMPMGSCRLCDCRWTNNPYWSGRNILLCWTLIPQLAIDSSLVSLHLREKSEENCTNSKLYIVSRSYSQDI